MAGTLDQFLRDGERVVYRAPRPWLLRYRRWHGLAILALGLGLVALNRWTAFDWGSLASPRVLGSLFPMIIALLVILAERCKTEVAVTDRRLLRAGPHGQQLGCRSIDLAEVAAVEFLPGAVRLTKSNGEVFAVDLPSHAPEVALAAAQAAGRPPPWVPRMKERTASFASVCLGVGGYFGSVRLQISALAAADLIPIPYPQCLLLVVLVFLVAAVGWLAVEPLALIALRPFWRRDEARAWIRYYAPVLENTADSDALQRFRRWRQRYFGLVVTLLWRGATHSDADSEARHGD